MLQQWATWRKEGRLWTEQECSLEILAEPVQFFFTLPFYCLLQPPSVQNHQPTYTALTEQLQLSFKDKQPKLVQT